MSILEKVNEIERSNQSFLRWHFEYIVHFQSRISEFLSAWTVGASSGTLIPSHHQEDAQGDAADEEQPHQDRYHDVRDLGVCQALAFEDRL